MTFMNRNPDEYFAKPETATCNPGSKVQLISNFYVQRYTNDECQGANA
jgi:hypothetical protein